MIDVTNAFEFMDSNARLIERRRSELLLGEGGP